MADTTPTNPEAPETEAEHPNIPPEAFRPTGWRCVFAAVVAIAAFFVPQEIPLEWYPLNNPGNDINYLEITCAANTTSSTSVFLNLGRGINELDKISWPIGPSEMAFTYTFPLWDAPIYELRLDPLDSPGELRITNFRIINRRNEEIVRFTKDSFAGLHDLAAIAPTQDGWKMVTVAKTNDPFASVMLGSPIAPVGMNYRNFLRCVLSTSYLAMMLLILLLAVFFAFYWPASWREFGKYLSYLALLGVLFSFVGNRGLIRNSISYARYIAQPVPAGLRLEMDAVVSTPTAAQLFWDIGHNIVQADSARAEHERHDGMQTLRFPLPQQPIRALRFDPRDGPGSIKVRHMRVVDAVGHTRVELPLNCLEPANQVAKAEVKDDWLTIETTPDGGDPFLHVKPEALAAVGRAQSDGREAQGAKR